MSCDLCDGRGWVVNPDGGNGSARRCACTFNRTLDERLRLAGVPEKDIADLLRQPWVGAWPEEFAEFPTPRHMLTLVGPEGRGKTRIALEFMARAFRGELGAVTTARYYVVEELLAEAKERFSSPEGAEPFIRRIIEYPGIAVLDEAYTQQSSPYNDGTASRIIRQRYSANRPTVTITNFTEEQLRLEEPRLVSRFGENYCSLLLDLGDWQDFRKVDLRPVAAENRRAG